jgi:hypothetical protein
VFTKNYFFYANAVGGGKPYVDGKYISCSAVDRKCNSSAKENKFSL